MMARSPYDFKCPVCSAEKGNYCIATKAEIIGAINQGDLLVNSVHSGRYLLAIDPALGKLQYLPFGVVRQ